jgi:hypothetical protein
MGNSTLARYERALKYKFGVRRGIIFAPEGQRVGVRICDSYESSACSSANRTIAS